MADVERIQQQALTWPQRARAAAVTDDETYVVTAELLKGIKALLDEADKTFDPIILKAEAALDEAKGQKAKVRDPLLQGERIIKATLADYDAEQKRKAREEQRRREEEARRQADADALEHAAALEREGTGWGDQALVKEAEQVIAERLHAPARGGVSATPPVPIVRKAIPRVSGIVHRTTWTGTCENLPEFIKHVAAHRDWLPLLQLRDAAAKDLKLIEDRVRRPEFGHLLCVRPVALNEKARALQAELNRIPGLRAHETHDVAAGRR